ncbi:MAG: ribosome assembly-like protein [Podoviridae sp. ctLUJ1]|nr:MAG: ribosome assembly-like protein [Podoviridae sp. ctLUJ1]
MSDADFAKFSVNLPAAEEQTSEDDNTEDTDEDTENAEVTHGAKKAEEEAASDDSDEEESDEEEADTEEGETKEETEEADDEAENADTKSDVESSSAKQLEKLFAPFNANGTQIKIDSVEEAIELMQMGANYHKKMHTLKPYMNLVKTLEKNNLLNEDSINFLIDLSKKDKNAISKLMADGEINPLDIETEAVNYSPAKHVVSSEEVLLDEVLQSIKSTPTFKETMDVITQQWDAPSKVYLTANPKRIADLNAHKASGLFDLINTEVTKQRMFGKLQGLSDFEAYEHVGIQVLERQMATAKQPASSPQSVKSKVDTEAQKAQKQKVAAPKGKMVSAALPNVERLASLSDEDFLKLSKKYI